MNRRTENQINAMLRAINRRRWHVVLLVCLALVVTAGVAGVFHLPAIAKTYQVTQLTCAAVPPEGPAYADFFVHIHNDDCFDANGNLVCPMPEIRPHRHTADCYTTTRTLICAVPESDGHQHTAACYTPVRGDLICELSTEPVLDEEGNVLEEGHVHTDECFAWTEELTCGMEAGEGAHHHDNSCYQTVTALTCEQPEILLHTHTDACYQKNEDGSLYVDEDGNTWLICGQLQVTEHVHGPECFTTYELDDGESEFIFMEEKETETADADAVDVNTEGEEPSTEEQETDPQTTEGSDEDAEGNDADTAETADSTEPNAGEENQEAAADEAEAGVEEAHTVVYTGTRGAEKGGMTVLAEIPEGALDENVQLILTDADENAARKQILRVINENAAEGEEREISSMLLLDIGFAASGEPAALNGLDPIRVTLRAAAIRGMSAPKLFHLTGGTAREVEDVLFDTEAGTVVFTSTTFSPFAVVDLTGEEQTEETTEVTAEETVSESMPAAHFEAETAGVLVTVDAPEGAFPEGTTMVVSQVEMDDDTLSNITDAVESSGEKKVVTAQAVDISFFDADQNLIEPKLPIRVSMKSAIVSESENVALVHLAETDTAETSQNETTEAPAAPTAEVVTDVQVVENPDEDNEIQFESDAFSVYVIVGTVIEKNVLASDGKNYKVTVTYGAETGIPEGAELEAEEILPDENDDASTLSAYDEYVSKTENALGMEEGTAGYIRLFDIKIVDKDDHEIKYQPAEGTVVDVRIELADAEEGKDLSVVHFADGAEEGDKVESSTESVDGRQTVSFEASGFSVYGIVDLDSAETAASVDGLDGNSYYLSMDDGNNRYYYTDPLVLVSNAWKFQRTTTLDSANRFYFEKTEPDEQGNCLYIYIYDAEGNKKYVNLKIIETNNLRYYEFGDDEESATKYTVEIHTEGSPTSFVIYHKRANKEFYYWNRNGSYFELAKGTSTSVPKNNGTKIILTKIGEGEDPYGLDGQSLGIIWNVNDTSGSGMISSTGTMSSEITLSDGSGKVKETVNILKNKSTTVRIDPVSRTDRVFVAQNSDITMWTFACCGPAQYYITAVVNGELKYVRFDDTVNVGTGNKGISLVDTPDERCKITVTEGTGTYSGKYKFSSNGRTLYNNNGNFYTVADTQNGSNVWMYFAEQSNLNDDDFVVYTAKKVSVSGTVNDDGTIDYDVKDGDQVVIYTRIWNETTLEYEYYAIDYDGMLVRAYMSGDNISWVGSKVNTMLWDFTEYHYLDDDGNETDVPNYYYELQNNYSGKYIAPQVTGDEFLADSPIGINLNGRRYNEYYSTILAWDDPYYDYAMLMVPENEYQLGSAPIALANDTTITRDFYFAIMTNDEESGELSTVETIDHSDFGITIKMINYPDGMQSTANGNYHNMIQTAVLGQTSKNGSTVYANLLKKNLSGNGYPDVALNGYTSHNLSELYSACSAASETTVNHTFLASTYSETGYFEYDCTQNFAHLITSADDIWYGKPMPGGGAYGIGDIVVYDQLGTTSETGDTRRHGQYFPYNDLAKTVEVDEDGNLVITPAYSYSTTMYNTTNIKGQAITSLDPRYGEQLYQIPNSYTNKLAPNVDHYFGMEMDASFMQSESGLDAWGHDLIFEFSGDDDFWLYIDGKLVLDLGGIHSACDGSVNFRTGEVNVNGTKTTLRALYKAAYLEENPDATEDEITAYLDGFFKDGGTVFKDYSGHTMKMFYMERGAGASNLHMRFNLAPYVNGEVQLEKEVSGTDTVSTQFPFQIWYWDTTSARFVQAKRGTETEPYAYDPSVLDATTKEPVPYQAEYNVNGVSYQGVYFLTPGQTASIQLPSEDTEYYFVECGIAPNTYDQVTANGEILEGTTVTGSDTLKNFKIEKDTVSGRKKVIYNNHVSDSAQKTLTVTKRLWRDFGKTTEIHSGDGADADKTNFRFRIYIGSGTDKTVDGTGYAVYNTGKYYVKNSAGEYCIWQNGDFVSTGETVFSELNTQKAAGEWKSEAEQATFYSSPGGAVDNIKAGYSIEIPGLMAGTPYYIEERSTEIPAGYNLIGYMTTEGSYSSGTTGTEDNCGRIAAGDTNRTVTVHNQHGYGLIVNKVWSDAAFMELHDDIYFGVYLNGSLMEDSVRRLHHPATSINWFFPELENGRTLNDYQVYELELKKGDNPITDGDITVDPDTGKVTWSSDSGVTVIKKEANSSINVGGISNEHGYSVSYSYTVSYERQTLTADDINNKVNSRTDTVSNARPGIKFVKTDLGGSPLGGAKFVLTDDSGTIRKTFTSAEDGLIVVSYLENDKEYTLTETAAPYGYQTLISSITIKKTVNDNGKTVVYVNGEAVSGSVMDETNAYELYIVSQVDEPTADNMPTITIWNKDYTLKAVKVDAYSYEPMKDVKFALYKEVYETVNGVPNHDYPMPDYNPMSGYDNLTTDENGVIPGIFMKNSETPGGLTAGTYYLREETPSGYNSLGFDIRITISETGEVTLQSATRPAQSGHWTFGTVSDSVASVAYSDGVMQITVKNTPKDPVRIKKLEMLSRDKALEGVKFELYKIGQIDDDGLPREDESAVISGATNEYGILLLGGLEENTSYYLYETEALPGYNMLTAPVIITTAGPNTINASLNGAPLGCQKVKDSNNNDVWEITVYNSTGYELPSTGGPGTNLIYLLGTMMTGIAGVGLVMRKRRRT
ncbi:MAG: LPXTG cell wall anchor domain-containing protein [Oscillospiraceae bacterium]|nr:LPXTG cell wall anchor domain-containing protein [Oscillospiraceae bacterium]